MLPKTTVRRTRTSFVAALIACAGVLPSASAANEPGTVFDWSGFYLGGTAGHAWGTTDHSAVGTPLVTDDFGINGWLAGGTLGWNRQSGSVVFGVELDLSTANIDGRIDGNSGSFGCGSLCRTDVNAFATVRGRVGYTFDRTLVFVSGGFAFANVEGEIGGPGIPGSILQGSDWRSGWTAGGGIELALGTAWTAKLEYLRIGVSDVSYSPNFNGVGLNASAQFDLVRFGLNYRWGRE